MKFLVLFLTVTIVNLSFAGDHEGGSHTPNYCSEVNNSSCAHLKFENYPTSKTEGEFLLHVLSSNGLQVENMKVKLWMDMGNGHGHGSAPVEIEATDELNHFHVQNAWFVMLGNWQVIVSYSEAGIQHKIIVPLEIKE